MFNGLAGTASYLRAFLSQEQATAFQTLCCTFGDDYSWHSGTAVSSSLPQVLSHSRVSWPVRCLPVSR